MKPVFRLLFLSFCLLASAAAAGGSAPALHRGITLSNWLADNKRQPLFTRDFMQIKAAGFDHVRLPFDPEYYGFELDGIHGSEQLNTLDLDRAVWLAVQNDLAVMLDVRPDPQFMARLESHPETERYFIALWKTIAARYKRKPADMLAYELLDEPQYYMKESYYTEFARKLVAAVRSVDKVHLIIVSAPRGSSAEGLLRIRPIEDPNIAYDFHLYSGTAGWNADQQSGRIQEATGWATRNHARILCGAFGVPRGHLTPESRYQQIAGMRQALEIHKIDWTLLDYSDSYGITKLNGKTAADMDGTAKFINPERGSRVIETQAYSALGLK